MDLNDAIEAARIEALSLGPKIAREIECLRRDIEKKIEVGELPPAITKIFKKGDQHEQELHPI
jgi:hypothetical protein